MDHNFHFLFSKTPPFLDYFGQRLFWILRLRFIVIFAQLPIAFIGRYYGYLNQEIHTLLMISLVPIFIWNSHLYNKLTNDKSFAVTSSTLTFQVSIDLIAFTLLLALTGGVMNPFYAFFYVIAILGGIFTSQKDGLRFFSLLLFCVFFIQVYPLFTSRFAIDILFNYQTFPYLISQLFIPSVVFFVARSFGQLLETSQKNLLNASVHAERLDRLRAVGALSAGFSHEFASPLHAAQIRLKRLSRIVPEENLDLKECKLALSDCENVLKQMNSSQLEMENIDFEVISLKSFISETIKVWSNIYPNIEIISQIDDLSVTAPKVNLAQSLLNILDNAAEAMDGSGKISLRVFNENSETHLVIEDEGSGLSEEIMKRLGEPFNTDKSDGTGLGLYATNLFMQSIAGKLLIQNKVTSGAKVEMIFPRTLKNGK